ALAALFVCHSQYQVILETWFGIGSDRPGPREVSHTRSLVASRSQVNVIWSKITFLDMKASRIVDLEHSWSPSAGMEYHFAVARLQPTELMLVLALLGFLSVLNTDAGQFNQSKGKTIPPNWIDRARQLLSLR
ncbi:hypothetical protein IFR05_007857, partial [Cadophora sp. M221]